MKMKKILTLDHHKQTTDYTCGPATVLSFLAYHDKKLSSRFTEKRLANILRTCSKVGTAPHQLYQCLQQTGKNFNLLQKASLKDLENSINQEHPAIVLWYDINDWHWSTVVGYDKESIILLDPYLHEGFNLIDKHTFNQYWSKLAIK